MGDETRTTFIPEVVVPSYDVNEPDKHLRVAMGGDGVVFLCLVSRREKGNDITLTDIDGIGVDMELLAAAVQAVRTQVVKPR